MKNVLFVLILFVSIYAYSQNSFPFKKGAYMTLDELYQKKPSRKYQYKHVIETDSIYHRFVNSENKRERKALAISDGKRLYLCVANARPYFYEKDFDQIPDRTRAQFTVAQFYGKIIYFEEKFTSLLASSQGLVATLIALRRKAFLYIPSKKMFKVIKNKRDFKKFFVKESIQRLGRK